MYTIGTRTDDGARLYIDGKLIIDDWTEHGEKPNSASVELKAGREYEIVFEHFDNIMGAAARLTWDVGQRDFSRAVSIAAKSDLVILVLGTSPDLSAEELDRMNISLPLVQQELVREIKKVNPNIVIVLMNGGPVALNGTENIAGAILEAWYAGQAGGTAIADVLFGDENPGGKLPETFYASTSQLPAFSDYDLINNPRTYMYFNQPVLYPFGHGLSYTTFEYSDLKLEGSAFNTNSILQIRCTVRNSGKLKGDEVVQLYVRDLEASVKVPIQLLKGFQRITLEAGEQKTVLFKIPVSGLGYYDTGTNDFMVEPGEFEIRIGSSSQDIRLKQAFLIER